MQNAKVRRQSTFAKASVDEERQKLKKRFEFAFGELGFALVLVYHFGFKNLAESQRYLFI